MIEKISDDFKKDHNNIEWVKIKGFSSDKQFFFSAGEMDAISISLFAVGDLVL
jgi:hypothetical protein